MKNKDNFLLLLPVTLMLLVCSARSAGAEPTVLLNDTGVTYGGNYPDGNNADCSGETILSQDCSHGRDATNNDDSDGPAGFSFTKLDSNGDDLLASASSWSCVRDNVTGLVWEIKTDDGGMHDQDNLYRWGGVTAISGAGGTYYTDWDSLVNGSNTASLCGFSDWRVPLVNELIGILNYSQTLLLIDTDYFPADVAADRYWSAEPWCRAGGYGWFVNFENGVTYYNYSTSVVHVRLIRGGQ